MFMCIYDVVQFFSTYAVFVNFLFYRCAIASMFDCSIFTHKSPVFSFKNVAGLVEDTGRPSGSYVWNRCLDADRCVLHGQWSANNTKATMQRTRVVCLLSIRPPGCPLQKSQSNAIQIPRTYMHISAYKSVQIPLNAIWMVLGVLWPRAFECYLNRFLNCFKFSVRFNDIELYFKLALRVPLSPIEYHCMIQWYWMILNGIQW